MDGHEPDLVARVVEIRAREHRHVRQIVLERTFLAAGRFIRVDRLLELRQIVEPDLSALRAEHGLIPALVEHGRQQLRDRHLVIDAGKALDQRDELPRLRPAQQLPVEIFPQRVIERASVLRGVIL